MCKALGKHEDLSLNAKHLLKKPGMSAHDCILNIESLETGRSQELDSQPTYMKQELRAQ